jgi:dTDP-4-amino-4,6-dideoxygalactose transaminase
MKQTMQVPYLDLVQQYRLIQDELESAILTIASSGHYVMGESVGLFENEYAAYCNTEYAIGVNSGTSALHLALLAAGIGPGDHVITVANTFVATVAAILYSGAKPVLVDINPDTYNIDVSCLDSETLEKARAIIPVHLYGQPADMDEIMTLARQYNLVVIEDASQSHGASYQQQPVGSLGDMACFSFYPGKNLGAMGEAGIIVTNTKEYADKASSLRDWGQKEKYIHQYPGFNYRMDTIQAAVLRVKLRHLDEWTKSRQKHAALYNELITHADIVIPSCDDRRTHAYHVYAIQVAGRDGVREKLKQQGIDTGIHYPVPVHLQEAYNNLGYSSGSFPVTESISGKLISLPIYPELSEEKARYVADRLMASVQEM